MDLKIILSDNYQADPGTSKSTPSTHRCGRCRHFIAIDEFKNKRRTFRGIERKLHLNCISCSAKAESGSGLDIIQQKLSEITVGTEHEPAKDISPLASICASLNLHVDLLNYNDIPPNDTPLSRFAHATTVFALATRLLIVKKRWRPVRHRGKLQPWQPFWQWFELFETRTFNIWNTKMQRYATGYAINKLEVFGLIRQLCDELGNIVNSRLEWARLETNQACMEMGVLDREDELEKHMVMVTDVIVQDCKDRGSLLLFEVLTKKVLDGRKFSKHWVLDTWID
ncbi:hypothetical protein HBH70_234580 [Parastagonospora nodorum]|nr:hypothetical protein HBH52_110830 [Parastagonospora nodorum]KAH3991175.1 hypothetical protein HBI10_236210 [Parastagonospora nodorum]KAH4011847.1 hypothetical protein HBI09_225660 [Parastagonospora nodorum]KAH4022107.1 hypothetical protein HBI13_098030 [Parastagonospora nodorum]KAH4074349.1 hypothetical protein HBH50_046110 [Parastagonospora nodorum]